MLLYTPVLCGMMSGSLSSASVPLVPSFARVVNIPTFKGLFSRSPLSSSLGALQSPLGVLLRIFITTITTSAERTKARTTPMRMPRTGVNSKSAGGPWRGKGDGVFGVTIDWTLPRLGEGFLVGGGGWGEERLRLGWSRRSFKVQEMEGDDCEWVFSEVFCSVSAPFFSFWWGVALLENDHMFRFVLWCCYMFVWLEWI